MFGNIRIPLFDHFKNVNDLRRAKQTGKLQSGIDKAVERGCSEDQLRKALKLVGVSAKEIEHCTHAAFPDDAA